MSARVVSAAVFVVVLLMASPVLGAGGGWKFNRIRTLNLTESGYGPPYDYVDGRIYMPDGTTLVPEGTLVQIIIGLNGAEIVDPKEHFDTNENGTVDGGEIDNLLEWVWAGADPAAISGGTNVLAYGSLGFTGEFATSGGEVTWAAVIGQEPIIANGFIHDKLAWRAWNRSKEDLEKWGDIEHYLEEAYGELWYTDGREYFAHDNTGGGPDTGWWIGMPDRQPGDPPDYWIGFGSVIGAEVYGYYVDGETTARSENRLDHYLGICVPEPGTMLLVGSGLLLFAAWAARKRARSKAG